MSQNIIYLCILYPVRLNQSSEKVSFDPLKSSKPDAQKACPYYPTWQQESNTQVKNSFIILSVMDILNVSSSVLKSAHLYGLF